jgi:hypothetical protein
VAILPDKRVARQDDMCVLRQRREKMGGTLVRGLGEVPTAPRPRNFRCCEIFHKGSQLGLTLGKRPLKRRGLRSEYNIKTDAKEIGSEDRIVIAQERENWRALVNVAMNLQALYNAKSFLTS